MNSSYNLQILSLSSAYGISFLNVEQVIAKVLMSMHDDVPHPTKVQIKITNLDKRQIQLYQKIIR